MQSAESGGAEIAARLKRRMERLLPVQEASTGVAGELDTAYSLRLLIDRATQLLDADRSTLFLLDEERQELWSLIAHGMGIREIRIPVRAGIAGHVAKTGETVNITDAYADPRFHRAVDDSTGYRTSTILCMPLTDHQGRIIGVIEVINKLGGAFTREDEGKLQQLCSQAALLLGAQMAHGPYR